MDRISIQQQFPRTHMERLIFQVAISQRVAYPREKDRYCTYFWQRESVCLSLLFPMAIKYVGIVTAISLPTVDISIPPLDFHRVYITLFQSTMTVSGVIVGFFAVCSFFMLNWSDRVNEDHVERIRKVRNPSIRNEHKHDG